MKHPVAPWIITAVMAVYVYTLSYRVQHQAPPGPAYDFYDTTIVDVLVFGAENPVINGRYNNIVEGRNQIISARSITEQRFRVAFPVNSPRPALLYINDLPIEIFLWQGDTSLSVKVYGSLDSLHADSIRFEGEYAGICRYYQDKQRHFDRVQLRSSRNLVQAETFTGYAAKLDSMAARELAFLAEREIFDGLNDWFVRFEKSDILYQKAYLKMSRAYNDSIDISLLDRVPVNNPDAAFSYFYYLYVRAYLNSLDDSQSLILEAADSTQQEALVRSHLKVANQLLTGAPRDVYLTRVIFQLLRDGAWSLAQEMTDLYQTAFSRKKYLRFLRKQAELLEDKKT